MNVAVKKVNEWFRNATKAEVSELLDKIILTERQNQIFTRFYLEKEDIDYISDSLNVCRTVVNTELRFIRNKILKVIG